MKNIQISLLFVLCMSSRVIAWTPPSHYSYHVGINGGFASAAAPKMHLGSMLGFEAGVNHHRIGILIQNFGDIALFQPSSYMKMAGVSYGWAWSGEFLQCALSAGGGRIKYQYNRGSWVDSGDGVYGELALNGLINWRGNGIGVRVAGNVNPLENYLSAAIYCQLGWAWDSRENRTAREENN